MHVDLATGVVNQACDRMQHDRPDDDRLHEVPVPDVVMEDPYSRAEQLLDLLAKLREVGRIERGLDLGLSQPVRPGHSPILRGEQAGALDQVRLELVRPNAPVQRVEDAPATHALALETELCGEQVEAAP